MILVHCPARHRTLQFFNGFDDPQPHHLSGGIALSRKGFSALHGLSGGSVAVPVYEQLGAAVDVEVVYDLRLAPGFFRGLA